MQNLSATFWVGVAFVIFGALSFAFNLWRDRRNRRIDQIERNRAAAQIEQRLRDQITLTKTETAEIATKVEQALQHQQSATDIQLTKQSEAVEVALRNQEIATRPDVNSGTSKIMDALDKVGKKADAAYHEANTVNQKLEEMSEAGLTEMKESERDSITENKDDGGK